MMTDPLVRRSPWLDQTPATDISFLHINNSEGAGRPPYKWPGSNVNHVPETRPSVRTSVQTLGALLHETVLELHSNTKWQDSPRQLKKLENRLCAHKLSELFGDLRNPRTSFWFFFCFFYIMEHVHSYSLLQCCLAVTLLKGDNRSVFLCGWTVPLRKRSLCSCHDPLWGSYLRLQLLNTSDQNLNAALSASSPNILITSEEVHSVM